MYKIKLLNDWINFSEGRKSFDKSHFYTLFHEKWNQNEIELIFNFFPNSEVLIKKFLEFTESKKKLETHDIIKGFNKNNYYEILTSLINNDLNEKERLCKELNFIELLNIFTDISFSFTNENDFFLIKKQSDSNAWLMESIGDYFIDNKMIEDEKTYALFEAFYGLTVNYQLVWFLGKPLINTTYNPDKYFQIWSHGADYVIDNNVAYISSKYPLA